MRSIARAESRCPFRDRKSAGLFALGQRDALYEPSMTTLADTNVSLPLLMGKGRHKNLRSLQRYVHPSAEAVAAMTAAHDPAARRRQH